MRIDENAEFTVVGLGPEGILGGSYNVINEYVAEKRQRLDERSHWAYLSIPNYDAFHTLVIGKTGENTVSDINFNLQLGLTQIYIEAHAELKEAVRRISDIKPESKADQDLQNQALMKCRQNIQEVTAGIRNSWDLQAALHVWRSHWQGGKPQKRFDQVLYKEILDDWKILRDKMGESDDLVGVGWLDSWIKGFLEVYGCEDDFYQQLMTWNMIHDVGDADFGHDSIRLWQAEINKFRFKHRKLLDIPSTMAGIKERMSQFRVMIMDPGSYHGWAAGSWYWQVKTDQFRSLATQLTDLEFRQRLQEHPDSQRKFEELDRLALELYIQQTIDTFKNTRKSSQAAQMIQIWHATFGLLINFDMICTGYLWSYIRSTSQMDTDVFILTYQDVEVKKGGWTCPITVDLVANFQIGLRGYIKRRVEKRARRKKNNKPKANLTSQDGEASKATESSSKSKIVTQEQGLSSLGAFEDAELIHDDGKRIQVEKTKSHSTNQPNSTLEDQPSESAKHQIEGEKTSSKKKKKKNSKKKGLTSAEGATAALIPPSTGDLMRAVAEDGALVPDIENSTETTDIDDAWQAAKQEFIGRVASESDPFTKLSELDSFSADAEKLKGTVGPRTPEPGKFGALPPTAVSKFDWFDETNDPTLPANDELHSITAKQIKIEASKSRAAAGETSFKENKAELRPGVQWSQIVGGGSKTVPVRQASGSNLATTEKQTVRVPKNSTAEKTARMIPQTDSQAKKINNISPDRKGKGKAIAAPKNTPPTEKAVQGPIGHILPSIGPWTEVSKKKKQTGPESELKHNAVKDRTLGKARLETETKKNEEISKSIEKSAVAPALVVELKMKEISNFLTESGKRQITTKATEMNPPISPRNVLRIVPKQVQLRKPRTGSSVNIDAAPAIKNNKEPTTLDIASEPNPELNPILNQPTPNQPNEPQGPHLQGKPPVLFPGEILPVREISSTEPPSVSTITTDPPAIVKDETGQGSLIAGNTLESLPVPHSATRSNTGMAEERQSLLTDPMPDAKSPALMDDTIIPDGGLEGSIEEVTKRQNTDSIGGTLRSQSEEPTELTVVPGMHYSWKMQHNFNKGAGQGVITSTASEKLPSAIPAPPKWKAYKLSAEALEFYSAYAPRLPRPHPAELDRFSAPDGWELSPERMDQDSNTGRNPTLRCTKSERIRATGSPPEVDIHHGSYNEHTGYGVRWQQLADGKSSPMPQNMLTQWLHETRGTPRTGEDITQLLEQSRNSTLSAPSLESLVALRGSSNLPHVDVNTAETLVDRVQGNNIMDDGLSEYVGYDLIPESEVANVYNLLEDYYRPRTS